MTMADSVKSKLLQAMQCPVCHESVKNAFLFPKCSQHFCRTCIWNWVDSKSKTCPNCRAGLTTGQLVKCPRFDELQEIFKQARLRPSLCQLHEGKQLSLFCYLCEACICVSCCYVELEHMEHKEQIVTVEIAFEHYKQTLSGSLVWLQKRYVTVGEALDKAQDHENVLSQVKEDLFKLVEKSMKLISSKADVTTLQEMLNTSKAVENTQRISDTRKLPILDDCEKKLLTNPVQLVFRFNKFVETIEKKGFCETGLASFGYNWKCAIARNDDQLYCCLKLVHGKPGKFGVAVQHHPERSINFRLNNSVKLDAIDVPEADNGKEGTFELAVYVRQSYEDTCQLLQDYTGQLEKQLAVYGTLKQTLWNVLCIVVASLFACILFNFFL